MSKKIIIEDLVKRHVSNKPEVEVASDSVIRFETKQDAISIRFDAESENIVIRKTSHSGSESIVIVPKSTNCIHLI